MPSRYKLAFGLINQTGTTMQATTMRDGVIIEGSGSPDPELVSLVENDNADNRVGTYEADAGVEWQEGDDIIYYYNGTIVASRTYEPNYKIRTNTK